MKIGRGLAKVQELQITVSICSRMDTTRNLLAIPSEGALDPEDSVLTIEVAIVGIGWTCEASASPFTAGLPASVGLDEPSVLCVSGLIPSASFEASPAFSLSPVFFSSSRGSSASGAEESSLSGVEALDALSTSALVSTLTSASPSVPPAVVVDGSSPSGRSVDGNAGEVLSGGGVSGEVGSVASVGLVDAGGSDNLVSSA